MFNVLWGIIVLLFVFWIAGFALEQLHEYSTLTLALSPRRGNKRKQESLAPLLPREKGWASPHFVRRVIRIHAGGLLEQLQQPQLRLIQSEKMSALGNLVAGVAHEINNPVSFIFGNITHVHQYTEDLLKLLQLYQKHSLAPEIREQAAAIDVKFLAEDLPKVLASMLMGVDRIREIVLSLRNFSRLDQAEVKPVDIHEGIDSTLLILQHRLKGLAHTEVQMIKKYGNLPLVECCPGQLNQVFMNILSNALEDQRDGAIEIITQQADANHVRICIIDNGSGMSQEVQQRIFDPFFTTKPVGKGTGMGMSISYQIVVENHQGLIGCESSIGQGTSFWVEIPVKQSREVEKRALLNPSTNRWVATFLERPPNPPQVRDFESPRVPVQQRRKKMTLTAL